MEKKVGKEEQSTPGLTDIKLSRATESSHLEKRRQKETTKNTDVCCGPPNADNCTLVHSVDRTVKAQQ